MDNVAATFPNGNTPRVWPRVIGNELGANGYRLAGQKSVELSTAGQVRSARRPPEFVSAKSTPYCWRSASVTTSPTSDSQARPSVRVVEAAHASPRGTTAFDLPTTV